MKDSEVQLALEIGGIIKQLRLDKNYSQEKLAELSGLDMTYVSMIERGKRNITLKSLLSICIALDIRLSDFSTILDKQIAY